MSSPGPTVPSEMRIRRILPCVRTSAYRVGMCRDIRTLHDFEPAPSSDEVHAAALRYVRKIAGTNAPSKNREEEAEKRRARAVASGRRAS